MTVLLAMLLVVLGGAIMWIVLCWLFFGDDPKDWPLPPDFGDR